MTILYNEEHVDTLRRRNEKNRFILCVVAAICVLEGLISCFLIGRCNVAMLSNVTKATFVLGGWVCIYYIFALVLPGKRKYQHLCTLLRMEFQELRGEVVQMGSELTVTKDIIAQKLIIKSDGEEMVTYWNADFGKLPFEEGQHVTLCVSNRFVISYMTEGLEDVT